VPDGPTASVPLAGGAEFDRIRAIMHALGSRAEGLGSDVRYIPGGEGQIALSVDVSVEGVHFRRDWLSPEEIGWRATASALSDLAAAGAACIGALVALTTPAREPEATFVALMRGVDAALESAGGVVLGGDLSRGDAMAVAVTVVGRGTGAISRRGARAGDGLWVTGELGGSRAALAAWIDGRTPDPAARERFARPVPRLTEGRWLADHGATAMIDLSDGLGADAGHLAAASGLALHLELRDVPVHPAARAEAETASQRPAIFAAWGGEDYELLAAMPPGFTGTTEFELTRIGEFAPGNGVTFTLDGRPVQPGGYDHFA
jgi:thiamine-monophosphate kinase